MSLMDLVNHAWAFILLLILQCSYLSSQEVFNSTGLCELSSDDDGIMFCTNKELTSVPEFNVAQRFDQLKLGKNRISLIKSNAFRNVESLVELDLGENIIEKIEDGAFTGLSQLQHLHMSTNRLTILRAGMFRELPTLQTLGLSKNNITFIEPGSFQELSTLYILDLGDNKLTVLPAGTFQGLSSLFVLHLINNNITTLANGVFEGLVEPQQIDLRFNQIDKIEQFAIRGLYQNVTVYSDDWRVCCIAIASGVRCKTVTTDESIILDVLFPSYDLIALFEEVTTFSSCEDLMHNVPLRSFIWILGIFSVGFNVGVIFWRLLSRYRHRRRDSIRHHQKSTLLAICLAFADLCMGLFLLIIATADHYFRGYYILQDESWRNSFWCSLAGFLSTFSSEFSVFILTHRYLVILYPASDRVLNYFRTTVIVACLLVLSAVLSVIPLTTSSLSDFYNQTGVCLALPLSVATQGASNISIVHQEGSPSYIYSFSVFIGLNTISVVTIIYCYGRIFWVAVRSNRKTTNTTRNIESRMGGRIMLIISTDMACWLPVIILGFLSALGYHLPPTVYAWIAVFVLPINSAINPLIYTFYTAAFQKALCRKRLKVTGSQYRSGFRDQDSFRSSYRSRRDVATEMDTHTLNPASFT